MAKTKVKEGDIAELFSLESQLGTPGKEISQEIELSKEELLDQVSEDLRPEILRKRSQLKGLSNRGRKKKEDSESYTRMTFVVNIKQLEKIREICYRDSTFAKDIIEEALGIYLKRYEKERGEVIPTGKAVFNK